MRLTKHPESSFREEAMQVESLATVTITCMPFSIRRSHALLGGMVGCRFIRTGKKCLPCNTFYPIYLFKNGSLYRFEMKEGEWWKRRRKLSSRDSKRCHLLSTVIELTVWHRYPHPSLHVINPWYNYFLLKFVRYRPEVFRRHDHVWKWKISNNLFKRKRSSKLLFTDTSRWLENRENWSFKIYSEKIMCVHTIL